MSNKNSRMIIYKSKFYRCPIRHEFQFAQLKQVEFDIRTMQSGKYRLHLCHIICPGSRVTLTNPSLPFSYLFVVAAGSLIIHYRIVIMHTAWALSSRLAINHSSSVLSFHRASSDFFFFFFLHKEPGVDGKMYSLVEASPHKCAFPDLQNVQKLFHFECYK